MYTLLLISQSPRRLDLLNQCGFVVRTTSAKISENIEENVNLHTAIAQLARRKSRALLDTDMSLKEQKILAISADTVVVLDNKILGKPENNYQAEEFLMALSNKMHRVITGFCVTNLFTGEEVLDAVETKVYFKNLSIMEIRNYIKTGEPMDKAGAYGIQGIGRNLIEHFEGSYSNVVGLPIEKLTELFKSKGWQIVKREFVEN